MTVHPRRLLCKCTFNERFVCLKRPLKSRRPHPDNSMKQRLYYCLLGKQRGSVRHSTLTGVGIITVFDSKGGIQEGNTLVHSPLEGVGQPQDPLEAGEAEEKSIDNGIEVARRGWTRM